MRNWGISATVVLTFALLAVSPVAAQIVGPEPPLPTPRAGLQITTFPTVCEGCLYSRSEIITTYPRLVTMPHPIGEGWDEQGASTARTGFVELQGVGTPGGYASGKQGVSDGTAFMRGVGGGASLVGSGGGGAVASPVMRSERKIRSVIRKLG